MQAQLWRTLLIVSVAVNIALVGALVTDRGGSTTLPRSDLAALAEPPQAVEETAVETPDTIREKPEVRPGKLVRVIDGDTLIIATNEGEETVRLIGIDAPETGPGSPAECLAGESTAALRTLTEGTGLLLERDTTQGAQDRYGRTLAYLRHADGSDVGLALIERGLAREYTYQTVYQRQEAYQGAQRSAREAGHGIWSPANCPQVRSQTVVDPTDGAAQSPAALRAPAALECAHNVYNCSSFTTQAEAQQTFTACGGTARDIHKLDRDGDGVVCESLP